MSSSPMAAALPAQPRRRAPRLAGDARRAQIVAAACTFFADNGFSGPTRDLAASIGVTQALLYRYFDRKTDLIDAVFAEVFRDHWAEGAIETLKSTANLPMVERTSAVYEGMVSRMTCTATRLLFRAGLDNYPGPIFASANRCWPIWTAMLDEWRREEGLPSLAKRPMLEGERALMLSFHNAMVMIRVREHVFHAQRVLSDAEEIRQVAETHDAGIREVLHKLHDVGAQDARSLPAADETQAAA